MWVVQTMLAALGPGARRADHQGNDKALQRRQQQKSASHAS